jgi:hypothetical protein
MIPWTKLFKVILHVFTRPMASRLKQLTPAHGLSRRAMMAMGRLWQRVNYDSQKATHKDEYYIDKGAELVSELFLYAVILGLPLY